MQCCAYMPEEKITSRLIINSLIIFYMFFFVPLLIVMVFTLLLYIIFTLPPTELYIPADVTFPLFHFISTVYPPLALIPFTEPDFHCDGQAGRSWMLLPSLWIN